MEFIQLELNQLEFKMNQIEFKVNRILELLEKSEKSNLRLDRHISFIERTYDQLRTPLSYLKNKVMWILGKPSLELDVYQEEKE